MVPTQMFKEANRTWIDRVIATLHRSCFKATRACVCGIKNTGINSFKILGLKEDCSDHDTPPFMYKLRDAGEQMAYHKKRILEFADG